MIGFEKIIHYKVLFLVLLWLGYGTGCISTPPEIPSQTEPENPSESASQSPSQSSSESISQNSSEGSSQPLSEGSHPSVLQELESRLELARKDLRISEATEARIASGLEQLKNSGNASPETLEDYETYLGRAREMVAENRKTVQELEALHAKYAIVSSGPSASGEARKASNPNLPDEKEFDELGKLDRKLDHSLAAFDELLLNELEEIRDKSSEKMRDLAAEAAATAQRLEEQGVSVDPSSTEAASGGRESARKSEQSESSPEKGEEGGIQSETSGTRQEGSKGEGEGRAPNQGQSNRPSGYDDDIVARQIREAAEKETDPVLKEKLWKEYENYKKGSRQ